MTEESNNPVEVGNEVGNVVWFDQRKGFGFIKIITPNSEYLNKEIFVHFSSVNSQNNFKKLFPGENVSLNVDPNTGDNANGKEFICSNVSGLYGTPLLVDIPNYIIKVIRKRDRDSQEGPNNEE
tara:strand:+ start:2593 stop:2964 length:372 start_codon:yes stop_codon:yes gene_type:complete